MAAVTAMAEEALPVVQPSGPALAQDRDVDARMVLAARADRSAFENLYLAYVDPIYRYCYRRVGNPDQAADLTSQVFIKALTNLQSCDPWKFRPWLFTIARNILIDSFRGQPVNLPIDTAKEVASQEPSPESSLLEAEERRSVIEMLNLLTPDQRQVVELRLAGLNGNEIADVLGRSRASVDTAQSRAVARLRAMLAPESATARKEADR